MSRPARTGAVLAAGLLPCSCVARSLTVEVDAAGAFPDPGSADRSCTVVPSPQGDAESARQLRAFLRASGVFSSVRDGPLGVPGDWEARVDSYRADPEGACMSPLTVLNFYAHPQRFGAAGDLAFTLESPDGRTGSVRLRFEEDAVAWLVAPVLTILPGRTLDGTPRGEVVGAELARAMREARGPAE